MMGSRGEKPAKPPGEADLSGRQLGDFRLLRRLGRGAMAEVYLADQQTLGRQVAIKVLKSNLADDPTYIKRFQREARAAASLVHANIVQIHEVGLIGGVHFIAQEYVNGQTLRQWLTRNGPPDPVHATSIMRQVAAALAKAAEQGIVHRDIKPENILLTQSGEVKVADFGLARVVGQGEGVDLTQVGITMGTPLYMSPEQVEGKLLDSRSDIYSFGVTCYDMLSGSPPFSGETALGVAVQHLKKRPKALETLRPDLPAALCRIVHKMLAKAPKDRYQSAREVMHEIHRLQVDQLADQWPEGLPGWESTAGEMTGPSPTEVAPTEVTEQLDSLMKTVARFELKRPRLSLWVAAAVCAMLLGAALALMTVREPSLLADAAMAKPSVPREKTALRQWFYAAQIGTEEAWRGVIVYFPEKEYLVRRAKQQLARIYLREGKYAQAMQIFDEFAALGDTDQELRAFGLAGKCGVLTLQRKYHESAAVMEQLLPIRGKLQDSQLRQLLYQTVRKNREELGVQTSDQWEKWLDEQFQEED